MQPNRTYRILCALLATSAALVVPAFAQTPTAAPATAPVVAPGPLDPAATAFRDGLAAALAGAPATEASAVEAFYADRGFTPFWTEADAARAATLAATLDAAADEALPAARYQALLVEAPEGASVPEREAALTRAYLAYAGDLSAGVLKPSAVVKDIARPPVRPTPAALLTALAAASPADALAGLAPTDPDYGRLVAEKRRLEEGARAASWGPEVPEGPTLHPGDTGPRVAELRARLARLGYLAPDGETVATTFDAPLEAAVERFQAEYGLVADGVVGKQTLAAVNAPTGTRLAQIAVNLERMRWMPRDLGARHLYVNIPDFSLALVENGAPVWQTRVVVGKARVTETPEFSDRMTYLVVNPTWHIPDSIAIRDYLPKLQKDPMVLARQNIRLLTRGGTEINPKLVDFKQYTPENFPFLIKQRPNEDNALGKVKFMFPNEFAIYLHDTPHKEYFPRPVRAYSNGCIRVEDPDALAELLLAGQEADPAATFDRLLATKQEQNVTLERPVPIHLTYRTVFTDEAGALQYRPDVYGRDAVIFEALEAVGVTLPAAQG